MDQLLMLSILFATVGIPAYCAYRYKSRRNGLKATLILMFVFIILYIVILTLVVPNFIF